MVKQRKTRKKESTGPVLVHSVVSLENKCTPYFTLVNYNQTHLPLLVHKFRLFRQGVLLKIRPNPIFLVTYTDKHIDRYTYYCVLSKNAFRKDHEDKLIHLAMDNSTIIGMDIYAQRPPGVTFLMKTSEEYPPKPADLYLYDVTKDSDNPSGLFSWQRAPKDKRKVRF